MTQEQAFDVVGKLGVFELRKFHPCVIAEVTVVGNFESAGSSGFGPLFRYIAGANYSKTKVAMTSPVVHEPGARLDVTQPTRESDVGNEHTIGFVMPARYSDASQLPVPDDAHVVLRNSAEELALVDRFSGRWSHAIFLARLQNLTIAAEKGGYHIAGPARFARFNPPWTPSFMRRNEIQLPITST